MDASRSTSCFAAQSSVNTDFFIGRRVVFYSASYAYGDNGGIKSGNSPLSET